MSIISGGRDGDIATNPAPGDLTIGGEASDFDSCCLAEATGGRVPRLPSRLAWPSGPCRDHIGSLRNGKPAGVDTQSADHGVFQGFGVGRRAGGGPEQVSGGLSGQRVAWLRPAAALSAEHDPPRQFIGSAAQPAERDGRVGQCGGVCLGSSVVLDRADRDQALSPSGAGRRLTIEWTTDL